MARPGVMFTPTPLGCTTCVGDVVGHDQGPVCGTLCSMHSLAMYRCGSLAGQIGYDHMGSTGPGPIVHVFMCGLDEATWMQAGTRHMDVGRVTHRGLMVWARTYSMHEDGQHGQGQTTWAQRWTSERSTCSCLVTYPGTSAGRNTSERSVMHG